MGAKVINYYNRSHIVDAAGFVSRYRHLYYNKFPKIVTQCDFVGGCACLLRIDSIKKHHLFLSNEYFAYHEDIDLFDRITSCGLKVVYNPKSIVYHKISVSSGGKERSSFFVYYDFRNRLLFVKNRRRGLRKALFFGYFFLFELPKSCIRSIFILHRPHELFVYMKALYDFTKGRFSSTEDYCLFHTTLCRWWGRVKPYFIEMN